MWESNSYKHSNLLDVLSRISNIVRSQKPIDETMMEIADSLHLQCSNISSSGICINYNNTQYVSQNFKKNNICLTSHFTTESDIRCKIEISSFKDKSKLSDKESNEGHVDTRNSNFECENPDTHLGCDPGIDVAG